MTRDRLLPLAVVAVSAIAFGQMLVIHDGLVVAHPQWSMWSRWVVAIGFELAIVVTGMAAILTGDRRLVAGELVLVALSVATAWWTILGQDGPVPRWVQAATLGFMPVQYLVAVAAMHSLWTWREDRLAQPAATRRETAPSPTVRPAPKLATDRGQVAQYLATVATVGHEDAAVAVAMGVSERTVRRYRALARLEVGTRT